MNKVEKETIIDIYYKDTLLAKQKRILYDNGEIKHKFYNPKTDRWVKFSTFVSNSGLNEDMMYLVRIWYYNNLHKPLLNYYDKVKAVVGLYDKEDGYGVILGPWDEHIARVKVGYQTFDIVARNEHNLVVEGICDIQDSDNKLEYVINKLEAILNELKKAKKGGVS